MNREALKNILKIRFSLKSKRFFLGSYRSAFKGTGMTFSDFREYCPGDDVRSVSWPLTAKMGKPYIKLFEEERGAVFVLMVDVSASSRFGSTQWTTAQAIEQTSALIAGAAEQNQDQVSLLLFSDGVEHYVPPSKGRNHVLRILRDIHFHKSKSVKTQFQKPCAYLGGVLRKKCNIFILSDFLSDDFEKHIRLLTHKHDVTAVVFEDILEKRIPQALGLIELEDLESGEKIMVDAASAYFQKNYKKLSLQIQEEREKRLKKTRADYFYVQTNEEDIFKPFILWLNKKRKLS